MDATVEAFQSLGTATVSDAMDRLGIAGQALGITPLDYKFRLCGRAFTCRTGPVSVTAKGSVGDYIDDVPAGGVVVIDNGGRLDATVWGDILTSVAHHKGIAGTVINGVCRDSARSLELNYPLYSRGVYMRTGKDRVFAVEYNGPVSLGEVRVEPDDIVLGDGDGVVVIPRGKEAEILQAAQEIAAAEQQIREAALSGMRLDEARKKFRYHQLQTRTDQV